MFSIWESKDKVLLKLRPEEEVARVCEFLMRQGSLDCLAITSELDSVHGFGIG